MKKIFLMFIAFFSISLIFNSCRQDGDWENTGADRYSFTIDRDKDFIEKGVGEKNQLTYNVNPSYKFEAFEMKFKYTSNLNGVLSLNGVVLEQNKEYTLTKQNNIFEYIGNVSGTHNVKIIATNSKGYTKTEDFELKYGVSEFTHTFTGGSADIYQSDETPYLMKIAPSAGQPSNGFEIKFNSYNGNIKLNGVAVQTGQYYPLPNIDNFTVILASNQVGQGVMDYTIKNSTVSKNYNIQQTIIARKIVIESMNINSLNVLTSTQMSLIGVIKKTPVTPNTSIKYKTWISASSNNNVNGIQNTNNVYTPYALTGVGSFNINFNAIAEGTYTYNIQVQDEFGNESSVQSYNVVVAPEIVFVGALATVLNIKYNIPSLPSQIKTYFPTFNRSFKVVAGGNSTIIKIDYAISFTHAGQYFSYNFTENVTNGTNTYEIANLDYSTGNIVLGTFGTSTIGTPALNNIIVKIKATTSTGAVLEQPVTATQTFTQL